MDVFNDILDRAIIHENNSYLYCAGFSKKSYDSDLRQLYLKLALEELEHKRILEIFKETRDIDYSVQAAKHRGAVFEDVDPRPSDFMNTLEVKTGLKEAIDKEKLAYEMYLDFRGKVDDLVGKKLLFMLAKMEEYHMKMLDKEYSKRFLIND
ncbi:ferritin family protein [Candidatus Woesearchaeota archaeon]|nr:ferritin family protein [Candidatus Woesearchaeota archaeon]